MTTARAVSRLKDPDRFLREQVCSRYRQSGYVELQKVDCHVEDGVVKLSGEVGSFYLKQLAQAIVLRVAPGRGIENEVRVCTS